MVERDIVVFGAKGQVASALAGFFPQASFVPSSECNFEDGSSVLRVLNQRNPKLVVNPAAYTAVDKAESEREKVYRINEEAPSIIAGWCAKREASLIHYSTDYVYSGLGHTPWHESDIKGPMNIYGASKLAGEESVRASGCHHIILRTSWVFSHIGQNFVRTMLKLGLERESLKIVSDQVGAPTYAVDLARATREIVSHPDFSRTSGVFNLANGGQTSWFEFASVIFDRARASGFALKVRALEEILSSDYPTPARRPLNSRLDQSAVLEKFGIQLRPWREALEDCLRRLI